MKVCIVKVYLHERDNDGYYDNVCIPAQFGKWEECDYETFEKLKEVIQYKNTKLKKQDFKYHIWTNDEHDSVLENMNDFKNMVKEETEKREIEQKLLEEKRKKELENKKQKDIERKLKQLEKLKKELGNI